MDVQGLSVSYGPVDAVADLSFAVDAGETVALIGANGAGKTSTINAIVGIVEPTAGSVRVFESDPAQDRATIARRWGVMPQAGGLPMGLRVGECVELFAALYQDRVDASAVIDGCGLTDVRDRRWRTLSGGQQQRLSLAVALVGGDDLLILDEPTAALDVPGQERVLAQITKRAGAGSAVLLTTHRLDEVEQVADRVVILHEGALVIDSSVTALTEESPEIRIRGLSADQASQLNNTLATSFRFGPDGDAMSSVDSWTDPQQLLALVLDWCSTNDVRVTSASVGKRSLADAYREMMSP